ncbi:mTERF family protein [Theileria parva strain Muguga]|uniref:mTERF family protein n=1 Tax=Theileria parva strain Muguga TaxID=333668 RepID=UPI001C617982|nr:mTERF family protein [Theileria parva strain Muguga]KAF5153459.1 mTERF family protein [Theileria parva strain Muguga]
MLIYYNSLLYILTFHIGFINSIIHTKKLLYINSPNILNNFSDNRSGVTCNIFFGNPSITIDSDEYNHQHHINEYFKKLTNKSGKPSDSQELPDSSSKEQPELGDVPIANNVLTDVLPLAPPSEDDPLEEIVEDNDLSKPPSNKDDWSLKRIAHGRRFWHKFFAKPSEQTLKAVRWIKFEHDKTNCNRILERTYTQLPKVMPQKGPDGKFLPLSKKDKIKNKHSLKVQRKIIGYDNSGEVSNLLILMNYPTERLVRLVEKLRMPGILDLKNYELLRLLKHSMLYLAKTNNFINVIQFLITLGKFNPNLKLPEDKIPEDVPQSEPIILPDHSTAYISMGKGNIYKGKIPRVLMRYKPMAYSIIGRLKSDPFNKKFLLPRKPKAKPIREVFPVFNPNSSLTKFLTESMGLVREYQEVPYDHDKTMDRSFSDIFTENQVYTTKNSVNKFDFPTTINFNKHLKDYLIKGVSELSAADIKRILKHAPKLGLTDTSTLIYRIKQLHTHVGLTYEEILRICKHNITILSFGNYKQRFLKIYDIDESFTYESVKELILKLPNLLTYNIDRCIKPKILYLFRIMGKSVSDLLEYPKYLSFSLYDRIIPRHLSVMNKLYNGEFLSVYRFLFQTGFYHSYGQPITHPKIPNPLPENHEKFLSFYMELNRDLNLKELIRTSDEEFCKIYNLTYRNLVEGREFAFKIPLPVNVQ